MDIVSTVLTLPIWQLMAAAIMTAGIPALLVSRSLRNRKTRAQQRLETRRAVREAYNRARLLEKKRPDGWEHEAFRAVQTVTFLSRRHGIDLQEYGMARTFSRLEREVRMAHRLKVAEAAAKVRASLSSSYDPVSHATFVSHEPHPMEIREEGLVRTEKITSRKPSGREPKDETEGDRRNTAGRTGVRRGPRHKVASLPD